MDAISAALEDYHNPAESPPLSPPSMRAMASSCQTNYTSPVRPGTSSPKFSGLRSLRALSGHTSPVSRVRTTIDFDEIQNEPRKAVIQASTAAMPVNCGPFSNDKLPTVGECSKKAEKPTMPENFCRLAPRAKLKAVKQFLSTFEYKQTPATHFNTHKLRPLSRIMDTARMIIYSPQPIKCVEAVFLALYLTAGISDCDRIPLGFKTSVNGQVFQHIVLLVIYGGKFGAFGISRQPDLMNKDFNFNSISDIVGNYKTAYEAAGHSLIKIRVGLPVEHKVQSTNYVCWRHFSLSPGVQSWEQCCEAMENHMLKKSRLWDLWLLAGKGGDPKRKSLVRKAALDTKPLVKDVIKKKKKVKTHATTMKAFAESEQVVSTSDVHKHAEDLSITSHYAEAKASKDRKRGASLAATKSLMKSRLLQSKTSLLIRQSAQFITPKLFNYRNLPLPLSRSSLSSSSQLKRTTRVSFNVGTSSEDLTSKEQQVGKRHMHKGKELQQATTGTRWKGKQQRS